MNLPSHLAFLGISYLRGLLRPLNPPFLYTIEPTNLCNFKCAYCLQSDPEHRNKREEGFLSLDKLKTFLEARAKVMPGSKNISFCLDGEPLLNKDFHDFVYLACRYGLFPRFSSNGRLLDEKKANELAAAGNFLASIDFASEVRYFENIRGTKEDYYAILENLQYLVNVAKRNKKIKLEIVDISSFAGTDPDKSLKNMRKLFPEKLPKNIMFFYRRFHNFCGHLSFKKRGYKLCPYPWTSFNITWKGDAVICCRDTEARTVLGNVFTDPILDIWYGDKYLDARRNLFNKQPHKNEACKNCDLPWSGGTKRWDPGYVVSSLLRR